MSYFLSSVKWAKQIRVVPQNSPEHKTAHRHSHRNPRTKTTFTPKQINKIQYLLLWILFILNILKKKQVTLDRCNICSILMREQTYKIYEFTILINSFRFEHNSSYCLRPSIEL